MIEADAPSKFMVKTTVEPDDEWLHSFTILMMKHLQKKILGMLWLIHLTFNST